MKGKSSPIRTALCAFGMSGKIFHGPFLKVNPHFEVVAVLERTKNESVKMFPGAMIYRRLEDMLLDETVELVIVNSPNFTHFDFTKKALEAGKHVVVEKPFTITAKEGLTLQRLAKKKGLVLSVYHNRRYDSDYKTIKKVLKKGVLGEVVEAEMRFDRYKTQPGNKLHKEMPGPGTGNLYDLGSHLIDQALQLFGMPLKIFADIDILGKESRVDDYFELLMIYGKLRVRIHSSYLAAAELPGYAFFGTLGALIKPKTNVQEQRLSDGEMPDAADWGTEPASERGMLSLMKKGKIVEQEVVSERGNYMDYYDQLYHSIRNGKPVPVSTAEAIRVIHLIELAYKSAAQGKVLNVNDLFK